MARYLIQTVHTPEECLGGLDDILALGSDRLAQFDFGCAVGDHSNHVCFTSIEAPSESQARALLPARTRDKAQINEVGKFTADQIRSYHAA